MLDRNRVQLRAVHAIFKKASCGNPAQSQFVVINKDMEILYFSLSMENSELKAKREIAVSLHDIVEWCTMK